MGDSDARQDPPKAEGADDIIVSLGDLSRSTFEQVKLDADYEEMVEDYIGNFNHMVTQGQHPMRALYAFAQAFAIVLGVSVRAGLRTSVGGKLIGMIVKNADASAKMVKIITKN